MRSASTGILAASQSKRADLGERRGGFTLLEALVALALILGFAAVLGPYLFQARRIIANTEGRVAAQVLLDGEIHGLRWRIVTAPMTIDSAPSREPPLWTPVRIVAKVSLGDGQIITAETVRLAKSE